MQGAKLVDEMLQELQGIQQVLGDILDVLKEDEVKVENVKETGEEKANAKADRIGPLTPLESRQLAQQFINDHISQGRERDFCSRVEIFDAYANYLQHLGKPFTKTKHLVQLLNKRYVNDGLRIGGTQVLGWNCRLHENVS